MRDQTKIFLWWLVSLLLLRLFVELPHRELSWLGLLNTAVQFLLFILAIRLTALASGAQRGAMLAMAIYFGFGGVMLLTSLVGAAVFPDDGYAIASTHLFVNKLGGAFVSLLAVSALVIGYFFPKRGFALHQLSSWAIAAAAAAILFWGVAGGTDSLSNHPDYSDGLEIASVGESLESAGIAPSVTVIADELGRTLWSGRQTAEIEPRVAELLPYTGEGIGNLYWRPAEERGAYASIACVILIALSLTRIYRSGSAHGAYIDKILLGLGVFHGVEALHGLSAAWSPSHQGYAALREAGHVVTIGILLLLGAVLNFKIRFSVLGAGRFYERAIATKPAGTTRFVDEIDTLILKAFFSPSRRRRMGTTILHHEQGRDNEH